MKTLKDIKLLVRLIQLQQVHQKNLLCLVFVKVEVEIIPVR